MTSDSFMTYTSLAAMSLFSVSLFLIGIASCLRFSSKRNFRKREFVSARLKDELFTSILEENAPLPQIEKGQEGLFLELWTGLAVSLSEDSRARLDMVLEQLGGRNALRLQQVRISESQPRGR